MNVRKLAFTLVEMLVVIAIIGVLVGLLMPALRRGSGDAARRMSCANRLKQIGFAMHNYHASFNQVPAAWGGTGQFGEDDGPMNNAGRLSGLVALLPYLESQSLWEKISNPLVIDGVTYPAMGPAVSHRDYEPWQTEVSVFRCPSDPGSANSRSPEKFALTNFTFSIGDIGRDIHVDDDRPHRGMFGSHRVSRFSDVTDGLAHTIAMTEIATDLDDRDIRGQYAIGQSQRYLESPVEIRQWIDPERPRFFQNATPLSDRGRGGNWADGGGGVSLVATIFPPNGVSFAVGDGIANDGVYTAASRHAGGAHVLMADGAVKFIVESIDTGDVTKPVPVITVEAPNPPTPYGPWGQMGTAAAEDPLEEPW